MRVEKDSVRVGIHSAPNHADDILCVALVKRFHKDVEVIRTRDEEVLKTCDYVLDVGGVNEKIEIDKDGCITRIICDHHAKDSGYEENGVKKAACSKLVDILYSDNDFVREELHSILIDPVAVSDNGQDLNVGTNFLNFVGIIAEPDWTDATADSEESFNEALTMTEKVLAKVLENITNKQYGMSLVGKAFNTEKGYIILEQYVPRSIWQQYLFLNDKEQKVFCVIFPTTHDTWDAVMAHKKKGSFECITTFPEKWCGKRDKELEEASGIKDAIFCHSAGFFWESKTKESAIKAVENSIYELFKEFFG